MAREICKICQESAEIKDPRGLCDECSDYSDEQILKVNMLNRIVDLRTDFQNEQERFLRQFGWNNSCNFPDSCWRWVKEIKGVTIAVSMSDAVSIERSISHYKN